jgi:hypothetical protein
MGSIPTRAKAVVCSGVGFARVVKVAFRRVGQGCGVEGLGREMRH